MPKRKCGESYTIPDGAAKIHEYYAFFACEYLTSVTIPNSVTTIGGSSFWYCKGLTEIINHLPTPQKINYYNDVFYEVNNSTCTLFVPAGSEDAYRAADGWKDFVNIKAIQ